MAPLFLPMDNLPTTASYARRLWALMVTFFKFGALTFGGGYAIVAMLEDELVHRKGWLTSEELLDIITVGESTPGPIAVNTATFVGYRLAGCFGGILATLSLVFPAWLIIVLISGCYVTFRDNVWVASALGGIRIAAIVLIARAFLRMGKGIARTPANLITGTLAFVLIAFTSLNAIWVILGALIFGWVWYGIRPRIQAQQQEDTK